MADDPEVKQKIRSFFDAESSGYAERHEKNIPKSMNHQVEALLAANVSHALDVGSGPGTLILELLKGGLAKATGVDLSPEMNQIASRRLTVEGLAERASFKEGSFLDLAVEETDAISMHRVLCCHPDSDGMLQKSVDHKPNVISLTVPRDWKFLRAMMALFGMIARFTKSFRPYIHTQKSIDQKLDSHGYKLLSRHKGILWVTSTYQEER